VGLAINHAVLLVVFKRELDGDLHEEKDPPALFTTRSALTIAVILATVVIYTAGGSLAFTALGGFALLFVVHRHEPKSVWERVDWSVLVFFGSLFIAVDALARSGAAEWAFARFPLVGTGPGIAEWLRAAVIFLVGSNVVTNVPFILIVRPEMGKLPDPTLGWELLAMASTFAGNLTLLGSVANVIVAEKAEPVGGMSFGEYLRFGIPIALLTTLAGAVLLVLLR
jgi:Na+/H+ antiporter NhaD/arsenite permease-like protein